MFVSRRYAEYYEILKKEGHVVYQILKRDMEQKGLDPAMLDVPDKAQPGQPGLTDCACAVSKFEPGMRYCKETAPEPTDGSSKWKSYETMYECRPCKLTAICGSCARICHKNHCVTAVFMRWRPTIDHCSCCIAKNPKRCKAQWSTERAAFDVLADEYDDCIGMDKIKQLLNALHGTEKEPVVSIKVICRQGRHRSCFVATMIGIWLKLRCGYAVELIEWHNRITRFLGPSREGGRDDLVMWDNRANCKCLVTFEHPRDSDLCIHTNAMVRAQQPAR